MTWDREGHLATSTAAGRTTTHLYTADGDRLLARAAGKTTLYLGDTEIELSAGTTTGTRYYAIGGTVIAVRTTNGVSEADAAGLAGQPADDLDSAAGLTEGAFDEVRTPDAVPGRKRLRRQSSQCAYLVTSAPELGHGVGADVAEGPGNQDPHGPRVPDLLCSGSCGTALRSCSTSSVPSMWIK
jgi:hypothetical protein